MIPTPHIEVASKGKIAKTVLMPGDPLRAKYIADNFLENVVCFNTVRNMFGYTGTYKGKKVSVMGSGMGMPSMGIYSYELYKFYDVERIIRIGSVGAYSDKLNFYDIVLATSAFSESTFTKTLSENNCDELDASKSLNDTIINCAKEVNQNIILGKLHSSDVYYRKKDRHRIDYYNSLNCLAVENESFALFANANYLNKEAACLALVTGSCLNGKRVKDDFSKLKNIIIIALESAIK